MPIDNYAKPMLDVHERLDASEVFFFDSRDKDATQAAIEAARAKGRIGRPVVLWKPVVPMPPGTRCVGHAPYDVQDRNGATYAVDCLNCGSRERVSATGGALL